MRETERECAHTHTSGGRGREIGRNRLLVEQGAKTQGSIPGPQDPGTLGSHPGTLICLNLTEEK